MPFHIPVLAEAVIAGLSPKAGQVCVDATLGGGSHALALAERLGPAGALIGIDQDEEAIEEARRRFAQREQEGGVLPHILLVRARFDRIGALLDESGYPQVDGVLFDLGVSSHQLDTPARGFSFRDADAPLDMRMGRAADAPGAADLLNTLSERELASIFKEYADERWSARIAQFVVRRRSEEPYRVAGQLVETVKAAVPAKARPKEIHPATRVFQALRIAVNDELRVLAQALGQAIEHLKPGGRIAIIAYQSGEDRIVKRLFAARSGRCQCPPGQPICDCGAEQPDLALLTRKPIVPTPDEVAANPRSRSAKLRLAEKIASPSKPYVS